MHTEPLPSETDTPTDEADGAVAPGDGAGAGPAPAFHQYTYVNPTPRNLRRMPRLLTTALAVVWRAAPRQLVVSTVLQVATGVALAAQLLVLRRLLSELLGAEGAPSFGSVVPEVVAIALLGALVSIVSVLLDVENRMLSALVALHTSERLIETATSVELVTYESPSFHDRLQRAQLSSSSRPTQLVTGLLGMAGSLFAIAGIAVALLVLQPLFFVLVMLAFVPAWLATNRAGGLTYRFSVEQTERDRRRGYLYNILTRKDEAQEVRAFDLGDVLKRRHRHLYELLMHDTRVMLRRRLRIALAGQLLSAVLITGAIALLVWLVTADRMELSAAGSAAGAMVMLNGRLKLLAGNAGSLYEGSLYLDDYASFVAAAPGGPAAAGAPAGAGTDAPGPLDLVQAEHVTFTYPSRTEPSVVGASLELRRGEVVALVGENGSGKTTLAKLLAGLYRPGAGSIRWNGVDTRTIDAASVASHVAVIFQDFVRYQLSARDNIALGDHRRRDDLDEVVRAAKAAGVHDTIMELERGYDTLLGPQFYGGSYLSGGQWQRIALARAFYRDAELVILDEPTAALDAKAEASLYASMGELFRGRGVLLISHRFGSVRTADRIYVLDRGRVVEQGTHDELMALGGRYAELFRLQAKWYVD